MANTPAGKKHKVAPPSNNKETDKEVPFNDDGTQQWPGAFHAYGEIWARIRSNPEPAVFMVAVYVAASVISSLIQHKTYGAMGYRDYEGIVQVVFLLALPTYALALADRRNITINQLWEQFDIRKWLYIFVTAILAGLIFVLSFLLLIVPAVWTIGWFSLYSFPVVERGLTTIKALKESKRLSQHHKKLIWGVFGATLVLWLPALILAFIPYLDIAYIMLVIVLNYGVFAALYRNLQQEAGETETE